jgi:WD40 repeat protein
MGGIAPLWALPLLAALWGGCDLPLPFGGGGTEEAVASYGKYRKALASRDRASLRSLLAKERLGELDDPLAPWRQYAEARRLPLTVTVLSAARKGDEVTVRLREGVSPLLLAGRGTPSFPPVPESAAPFAGGTVRMVRQDGSWRVAGESWTKDPAAEGSGEVPTAAPFLKGGALPSTVLVLAGHGGEVSGIAFVSEGRVASAGSGDGTIRLWSGSTGALLAVEREESPPRALAATADGSTVVTADGEGRVTVRDVIPSGFGPPVPLPGSAGRRPSLAVGAGGALLAAASVDGRVTVWSLAERRRLLTLETGVPVRSVAFSPTAPLLAAGSATNSLFLWDLSAGKGRRIVVPEVKEDSDLCGVAFRPDGARLASAHADGSLLAWDVSRQEVVLRPSRSGPPNWGVAFSPDGAVLATANQENRIQIRNGATGAPLGDLVGHGRAPRLLAFHPAGGRLLSADAGGEIRVWE